MRVQTLQPPVVFGGRMMLMPKPIKILYVILNHEYSTLKFCQTAECGSHWRKLGLMTERHRPIKNQGWGAVGCVEVARAGKKASESEKDEVAAVTWSSGSSP
jgi:hypothetical protein